MIVEELTVGNGGPDAGEDEEERGNELGHVGLEGRGAERVAQASKCKLHHLFFFFLSLTVFQPLDRVEIQRRWL